MPPVKMSFVSNNKKNAIKEPNEYPSFSYLTPN